MIVAACAAVVGALSRKPSARATMALRRSSSDASVMSSPWALNRSRNSATWASSSSFRSRPK